jgi:transcriptional regulator with XRE-family HTH domain
VAANIDRGIRARAMTNRAVGEAIGSTEHQVWRWRAGRHMPDPQNLAALANVLFDGNIAELYADDEPAAA